MSKAIATALNNVMKKVSYVQKQQTNDFHRYKYAGEADLLEVLRPALIEEGLVLIPSVSSAGAPDSDGNTTVLVEYTLAHKGGDIWPDKIVMAGCGNDRAKNGSVGDKGIYKALTGANKYLLFKLFQIETGDDPEVHKDGQYEGSTHQGKKQDDIKGGVSAGQTVAPRDDTYYKQLDVDTSMAKVDKKPVRAIADNDSIVNLAVEAVDSVRKEKVDVNTILPYPTSGKEWDSTITIALAFFEIHRWPDLKKFWQANNEVFNGLKSYNTDSYANVYKALMAKKPGIKA
jgi:hypothetical protein